MNPIKFFTNNIFPFRISKKKQFQFSKDEFEEDNDSEEQVIQKEHRDLQKELSDWKSEIATRHFINGHHF